MTTSVLEARLCPFPPPDWPGMTARDSARRGAPFVFDDWCRELLEAERRGDRAHVDVLLERGRRTIAAAFAEYAYRQYERLETAPQDHAHASAVRSPDRHAPARACPTPRRD